MPPDAQTDYRTAREKYNPTKIGKPIDVLWIAESPPSGGGYFYFEEASGKDHLFRETMKALRWWNEDVPMRTGLDKRPHLRRFQQNGHFLIDLSPTPVNNISAKGKRNDVLRSNVGRILREVEELDPKKILIVKRNVFEILYPVVRASKFDRALLNRESIPFPSNGWQAEYRRRIRGCIRAL